MSARIGFRIWGVPFLLSGNGGALVASAVDRVEVQICGLAREKELGDSARAFMAACLNDHVDRALNIIDHVGIGHRHIGFQGGDGEAANSKLWGLGMQRSQRSTVAGVDCLEKRHRLATADFA